MPLAKGCLPEKHWMMQIRIIVDAGGPALPAKKWRYCSSPNDKQMGAGYSEHPFWIERHL